MLRAGLDQAALAPADAVAVVMTAGLAAAAITRLAVSTAALSR
jgi:hypothetical protein